jgi:hypothetical protein
LALEQLLWLDAEWSRATINETELFQAALGVAPPWLVDRCEFSVESGRLDIYFGLLPVVPPSPVQSARRLPRHTIRTN